MLCSQNLKVTKRYKHSPYLISKKDDSVLTINETILSFLGSLNLLAYKIIYKLQKIKIM